MASSEACIAGVFEHPTRKAEGQSVAQLHAEVAYGALQDAGLSKDDVDGFFCTSAAPGLGPINMADYMGLTKLRHVDSTDMGGCSYVMHVGHAAQAIKEGRCNVALITLAGRPRSEGSSGTQPRHPRSPRGMAEGKRPRRTCRHRRCPRGANRREGGPGPGPAGLRAGTTRRAVRQRLDRTARAAGRRRARREPHR